MTEENTAAEVLTALLVAEKKGQDLERTISGIVGEYGWTENIAVAVFRALSDALSKGG